MAKYQESTVTITGFKVLTAQPLSVKEWFEDLADLQDITVNNDPLSYYEGMYGIEVETGKIYRWMESSVGALAVGYTYGTYEHDGVVYTGRTFNFVDVGNNTYLVPLGGSFPNVEATPIGSIAIYEFVDTDTFVGVYELQAGSPNAWVEIMRTSTSVSYAWIKTQIEGDDNTLGIEGSSGGLSIGYGAWTDRTYVPLSDGVIPTTRLIRINYAGSGGDFGTSQLLARGDHTHTVADLSDSTGKAGKADSQAGTSTTLLLTPDSMEGSLVFRGELVMGQDLNVEGAVPGIYTYSSVTPPSNFPLGTGGSRFIVYVTERLSSNEITQIIYADDNPLCWIRHYNGAWGSWVSEADVIDTQILDTGVSWTGVPFDTGWAAYTLNSNRGLSYRVTKSGLLHINGAFIYNGGGTAQITTALANLPSYVQEGLAKYVSGVGTVDVWIQIDTAGILNFTNVGALAATGVYYLNMIVPLD